jgi:polyvinyl alcohol dehydrogenase (cytochrome)
VYFGLDNGTLAALDLATGRSRWSVQTATGQRGGLTAALTVTPGVVWSGGRDGLLRAHAAADGRLLWQYDMLQDVPTVNGVTARGGAMGAPGPTVAGGLVFVPSGYPGLGNGLAGTVLLGFGR